MPGPRRKTRCLEFSAAAAAPAGGARTRSGLPLVERCPRRSRSRSRRWPRWALRGRCQCCRCPAQSGCSRCNAGNGRGLEAWDQSHNDPRPVTGTGSPVLGPADHWYNGYDATGSEPEPRPLRPRVTGTCYSETASQPRTQCRRRSNLNSFAARMARVTDGAGQWTGDTDDWLGSLLHRNRN